MTRKGLHLSGGGSEMGPLSSLVAPLVKDPVLSLQWLGLLLWHGFHPWPWHFHVLLARLKIIKENKNRRNWALASQT